MCLPYSSISFRYGCSVVNLLGWIYTGELIKVLVLGEVG